ncbi:hypothetical protein GCM10023208_04320 [Erythrobacter westpacificensis]|uniref:Transposase n=1 Tax=Erythrobacter westpacificensis TaxID=1055231 RepID=A0ABP9K2P5_9SPHN
MSAVLSIKPRRGSSMFYVGVPAKEAGVRVDGDLAAAERFITLFALPEKIG